MSDSLHRARLDVGRYRGATIPVVDFTRVLTIAEEAVAAAGALVRARLFGDLKISPKGSGGDVVTSLDLQAEHVLIQRIRQDFPGHRVVSEEAGVLGEANEWTWLIDPIDGTNNLVIGLPVLAVGVTLLHRQVPVLGAVHDPVSGRTLSAVKGQGLRDNQPGRPAHRRPGASGSPVLAWIQGYGVPKGDKTARDLKGVLSNRAHRVLDLWAPLTCWAMLARGDIDGIVGYRIGELDLHAGALIAQERGVVVRDLDGGPYRSEFKDEEEGRSLYAADPSTMGQLGGWIEEARGL